MDYTIEIIGGGILTVMILKEVFAFIIRNRNGRNGSTKIDLYDIQTSIHSVKSDVEQIKSESRDLWVWHNKEDPDEPGVKVWYANKRRTEDALVKIAESIEKQTEILEHMAGDIKELKMKP